MCSVLGCYSGRRTAERFKLPEDPEERLEWVVFLAKANKQRFKESCWTEISVCSEHFTEDCFVHEADPVQLKPGSVPSVCLSCGPDAPVMSSICENSVGNAEVVRLSDQAKIRIGATSCSEESMQTLLGSHNGPVSARASCSSDSSVCFQPKAKPVDIDLIKKKVALLKTKGKFPVNEKRLVRLFSRMCPSCGGKLKMHKASRGVVIFLHQLCLQCDYTYEWKSLVDGNVPAAEDRHRTGSSKAAAADETSSSVSEAPEMAAVMNEESDSEDEPEESSDPDDVDSDEDWKPAAGAFTVELFPAKRNEEVDKRAGYSDYLEAAPPYNRLCTDCGTFFDRRTPHMCNHKVKPYSCNICGKRFVSKVALNHHNEIHNENYEFSCKFCHVSFKAKADKFTHEQIHIAERNSYKCPDCSRTFATNKELRIHLEEHKMQMQVKCHLCEMEFVSLSSLRRHMTVHTGVKRFTCFVCQRTFNQKGNLKTHMRLHTGEKPYKCQLCDKCFTQNVSLKLHIQRCHTFSSGPELERSNEQEHDSDDARANGDETGEDFGFDSIKEEQDANDVQMDQRRLPKIKKKSTSGSKGRPRNSGSRNIVLEDDAKYHGSNIRSKAHVKRQKMTDEDSKNTPSDSNASFDSAEEEEMWTMNTERQTRGAKPDMKVCSRNKSGKRKGRPRKNLK